MQREKSSLEKSSHMTIVSILKKKRFNAIVKIQTAKGKWIDLNIFVFCLFACLSHWRLRLMTKFLSKKNWICNYVFEYSNLWINSINFYQFKMNLRIQNLVYKNQIISFQIVNLREIVAKYSMLKYRIS